MEKNELVYLSLGSNLGQREHNISEAIKRLNTQVGNVFRTSDYHYSQPEGFLSKNEFCNVVISLTTDFSPHEVLKQIKLIEKELGRSKKSRGCTYFDREIDIDIIMFKNMSMTTKDLTIPHPRWKERAFVYQPLNTIL